MDITGESVAGTRFRVTMMLCDHAQVAEGKLFISGGGWSNTSTPTEPTAVAVLLQVPWGEANRRLKFALRLLNGDGRVVLQPGPAGQPIAIESVGTVEVGRPPGLAEGSMLHTPLAIKVAPLLLEPGRYVWEFSLDGRTEEDWNLTFNARVRSDRANG